MNSIESRISRCVDLYSQPAHWVTTKNDVHLLIDGEGKVEKPDPTMAGSSKPAWFKGGSKTEVASPGNSHPRLKKAMENHDQIVNHEQQKPSRSQSFQNAFGDQPMPGGAQQSQIESKQEPKKPVVKKVHELTPEEMDRVERSFKKQIAAIGAIPATPELLKNQQKMLDAIGKISSRRAEMSKPQQPQSTPAPKPKLKVNLGQAAYDNHVSIKDRREAMESQRKLSEKAAANAKTPGNREGSSGYTPGIQNIADTRKAIKSGKDESGNPIDPKNLDKMKRHLMQSVFAAKGLSMGEHASISNLDRKVREGVGYYSKLKDAVDQYRKTKVLPNQRSLFDEDDTPESPHGPIVVTKKITTTTRTKKHSIKSKTKPGIHWITIHGHDGKGTHIQVKDDGTIVNAPGFLKSQGITKLSDFGKVKEAAEKAKELEAIDTIEEDEGEIPFQGPVEEKDSGIDDGGVEKSPDVELAERLADRLKKGEKIDKQFLFGQADEVHGGTRAENAYGQSDAYDSLEAAVNKHLEGNTDPTAELEDAQSQADEMDQIIEQLPTQTDRTGNKNDFQQFSTPPHYAFACNWVANLQPGDKVLEPSAGTGSLAIHAKNAGAEVYANELDDRRADFLRDQFGDDHVFVENAEQIAGILPGRGVPEFDVVIMNPPFSQTAGRMGNKKQVMTGAKHIEEAALLLKDGGRLVSIVGGGMGVDSPRYREWFKHMADEGYDLKANVLVDGDVYTKYGTKFDSRVLVFDKQPPTENPVLGEVSTIADLMAKLEGVRNERTGTNEPAGEPFGNKLFAPNESTSESDNPADSSAGSGMGGEAGAGREGISERPENSLVRTAESTEGLGSIADGSGSGVTGDATVGESGTIEPAAEGNAERAKRGSGKGKRGKSGGETSGEPVQQPQSVGPKLRPAQLVEFEEVKSEPVDKTNEGKVHAENDLGDSLYDIYHPQVVKVKGAQEHPSALVESAAMAAVRPPVPTYKPMLSPDIVEKGMLSEAALETLVYAGQSHEQMLEPNADGVSYRKGFFLGDGTGSGKGRQLAGIMTDNFNQGRKKAVWITKSQGLFVPTNRDLIDVGFDSENRRVRGAGDVLHAKDLHHFDDLRKGNVKPDQDGVMFMTYDTLRSKPTANNPEGKTNLDTLVDWLGKDFDGVVAFDESHLAGNAMTQKGPRGEVEGSQRAMAVLELQKRLPNARVVYSSATGATEVRNLAYAERLGIWGKGTAFPDKHSFIDAMESGGIASMEQVAQSLKATGSYCARTIAMDNGKPNGKVEYDRLTHSLSPDQIEQYDALADGWQNVLQNIDKALEFTGGKRGAAQSQFWGAQQRFFNQVMTSMQTPAVIQAMEDDFAGITRNPDGSVTRGKPRTPVIQLVNTMESATKKALASRNPEDDDADIDISPRQMLIDYLEHSFPTERHEEYEDEDGNKRSRMVMKPKRDANGFVMHDDKGNELQEPVHDPRAVELKNKLISEAAMFRIPEPPIDQIINHFGHNKVAEITGRKMRRISIDGGDPSFQQRNPSQANPADHAAFLAGRKQALIFSGAGNTGFDYHAGKNFENQGRRTHYMLQPGWRADEAVQGFGRTNRTNQSSAPYYRLVEIDQLKGQKRFISTIARRLDQLGALTKGQRQTGGGGLFKAADNLESKEASAALEQFFNNLERGRVEGLDHGDVMRQMGLAKAEEQAKKKGETPKIPEMGQFLNRMLSMRVDMQGKVFEAFDSHLQEVVERAIAEGTLDTGVENYPASSIKREKDTVVFQDPKSGAEARHIIAKCKEKAEKTSFEEQIQKYKEPIKYVKNKRSGSVWAAYRGKDSTDPKTGSVSQTYVLRGPKGKQYQSKTSVDGNYGYSQYFDELDAADAKHLWDDQHAVIPDYTESDQHFLTGALLPVWDRIPGDKPKVYRMKMEDGQTIVGRHIHEKDVPQMLERMGVHAEQKGHTPESVHSKLIGGKHSAKLANGWKLNPVMRQGERRIQLIGPSNLSEVRDVTSDGVMSVMTGGYKPEYFIPTGQSGIDVLHKLTKNRPVADVSEIDNERYSRLGDQFKIAYARQQFESSIRERFLGAVDQYAKLKPASNQKSFFDDDEETHWITLKNGESGTTHVQIDSKGNMLQGQKDWQIRELRA